MATLAFGSRVVGGQILQRPFSLCRTFGHLHPGPGPGSAAGPSRAIRPAPCRRTFVAAVSGHQRLLSKARPGGLPMKEGSAAVRDSDQQFGLLHGSQIHEFPDHRIGDQLLRLSAFFSLAKVTPRASRASQSRNAQRRSARVAAETRVGEILRPGRPECTHFCFGLDGNGGEAYLRAVKIGQGAGEGGGDNRVAGLLAVGSETGRR